MSGVRQTSEELLWLGSARCVPRARSRAAEAAAGLSCVCKLLPRFSPFSVSAEYSLLVLMRQVPVGRQGGFP